MDGIPNNEDVEDTTMRHLGDSKKTPLKKKLQLHLKKGALHKELGVSQDKDIPEKKLDSAKKDASPLEKKRIQFAENARKWKK